MLNRITTVEVCDATMFNGSNAAKDIKITLLNFTLSNNHNFFANFC